MKFAASTKTDKFFLHPAVAFLNKRVHQFSAQEFDALLSRCAWLWLTDLRLNLQ